MKPKLYVSDNTLRQLKTGYGDDGQIVQAALDVLTKRFAAPKDPKELTTPEDGISYLRLIMGPLLQHETFFGVFLNNKLQVLAAEELFRGGIDQVAANPREIVRRALELNATALLVAHNHPSHDADPSPQDIDLTKQLGTALGIFDIRLLDHIVISGDKYTSIGRVVKEREHAKIPRSIEELLGGMVIEGRKPSREVVVKKLGAKRTKYGRDDPRAYSAFFSVPPQPGKRSVVRHDIAYVSQREVAHEGKAVVVASADSFYGGDDSKPFRSRVLTNPTYGQLNGVATQVMRTTRDVHHSFFEGFRVTGSDNIDGEDVAVLTLYMGS